MNRLSLRNNRLKFKSAGKLPIILEEFIEYTSNLIKENRRMSTCNWLDFVNTRISTDYAKKSPQSLVYGSVYRNHDFFWVKRLNVLANKSGGVG